MHTARGCRLQRCSAACMGLATAVLHSGSAERDRTGYGHPWQVLHVAILSGNGILGFLIQVVS